MRLFEIETTGKIQANYYEFLDLIKSRLDSLSEEEFKYFVDNIPEYICKTTVKRYLNLPEGKRKTKDTNSWVSWYLGKQCNQPRYRKTLLSYLKSTLNITVNSFKSSHQEFDREVDIHPISYFTESTEGSLGKREFEEALFYLLKNSPDETILALGAETDYPYKEHYQPGLEKMVEYKLKAPKIRAAIISHLAEAYTFRAGPLIHHSSQEKLKYVKNEYRKELDKLERITGIKIDFIWNLNIAAVRPRFKIHPISYFQEAS